MLYQSVTGDPGHRSYFPMEAVSWKSDVGDIASLVTLNRGDFLQMRVYCFTDKTFHAIRTKMLQPGSYLLESRDLASGERKKSELSITGSGSEVELNLFPRREQMVSLTMI